MTSATNPRAKRIEIPCDFPHKDRLGGRDLFIAVLGNPAPSTFARWLGQGKLPKPVKLGSLNRWTELDMAATRKNGIA